MTLIHGVKLWYDHAFLLYSKLCTLSNDENYQYVIAKVIALDIRFEFIILSDMEILILPVKYTSISTQVSYYLTHGKEVDSQVNTLKLLEICTRSMTQSCLCVDVQENAEYSQYAKAAHKNIHPVYFCRWTTNLQVTWIPLLLWWSPETGENQLLLYMLFT